MRTFRVILPAASLLLLVASSSAAELLPPDRPIEQVIDHYVDELMRKDNIAPAPPADDHTVIRRLTLDLCAAFPRWTR